VILRTGLAARAATQLVEIEVAVQDVRRRLDVDLGHHRVSQHKVLAGQEGQLDHVPPGLDHVRLGLVAGEDHHGPVSRGQVGGDRGIPFAFLEHKRDDPVHDDLLRCDEKTARFDRET